MRFGRRLHVQLSYSSLVLFSGYKRYITTLKTENAPVNIIEQTSKTAKEKMQLRSASHVLGSD